MEKYKVLINGKENEQNIFDSFGNALTAAFHLIREHGMPRSSIDIHSTDETGKTHSVFSDDLKWE